MCRGLIGKKIGMTSVFTTDGKQVPVTVIEVGPCMVTQIKTVGKEGYDALQLAFGEKKLEKLSKPEIGHLKKSMKTGVVLLREFSVDKVANYTLGQEIRVDLFQIGEKIDISGISKGRGFAGVIRRHGFHGGRSTHGSHSHRIPGSIGSSAYPSRVMKGKKLPGHLGSDKQTVKNLTIVDIRPDLNLILVKGAVPGTRSGYLSLLKPKFSK
jgi:large subunit ribosomal protein L3